MTAVNEHRSFFLSFLLALLTGIGVWLLFQQSDLSDSTMQGMAAQEKQRTCILCPACYMIPPCLNNLYTCLSLPSRVSTSYILLQYDEMNTWTHSGILWFNSIRVYHMGIPGKGLLPFAYKAAAAIILSVNIDEAIAFFHFSTRGTDLIDRTPCKVP